MRLKTLQDFLDNQSNEYNNSLIKDNSSSLSFKNLFQKIKLNSQNIYNNFGTQKRFLIAANNNIFFTEALLSVICSGNIAIPVNPELNENQISQLINKFHIDYYIKDKLPDISNKDLNPLPDLLPETPALALFTSGTTGEAKLVVMSHENILFNAYSVIKTMNLSKPENLGLILPLYHSFALITQLITTLLTGGNIFFAGNNKYYDELSEFIIKNQINTIAGVPTNFKMLLFGQDKKYDSVKHITVAGASLDKNLAEEIKKSFFNAEIWVGYGLTEAGPRVTAINYNDPKFLKGSVGKPINEVEIKLLNNEILVKSQSNMIEYLDDSDATNKKINHGYLYSGDTGFIDEEGYLYITGRKDDIFMSGGEKISPLLIEKVINHHPDIANCAVFGEEDQIMGKRIIAVIKLKEEKKIRAKELLIHCSGLLDKNQIPHKFFKTEELPMTPNGKIMRKELPLCRKEKI